MKKITFAFFILLFLLFRPYQLQKSGMIYTGDDYSYFAYSTSIVFGTYPSFTKEYVDETAVPPLSRVGPGLMAAPFVFLFSFIDRTVGNEIITQRTHDSIKGSWCEFGFIFSTLFYFYFSCVLLFNALRKIFTEEISVWSVVLMVFAQGVGIYAFRRPVFSHIYELFLHSAFLYLFIKSRHDKF